MSNPERKRSFANKIVSRIIDIFEDKSVPEDVLAETLTDRPEEYWLRKVRVRGNAEFQEHETTRFFRGLVSHGRSTVRTGLRRTSLYLLYDTNHSAIPMKDTTVVYDTPQERAELPSSKIEDGPAEVVGTVRRKRVWGMGHRYYVNIHSARQIEPGHLGTTSH